jgi:hypothetical protein
MRNRILLAAIGCLLFPWLVNAAGPTTKPALVHLDFPAGWQEESPRVKHVQQYAVYPELGAYAELIVESKADFADDVDLMAWAARMKEAAAKKSTLAHRTETELKAGKIGSQTTVEYEVTGEIKGVKLHYRNILFQVGDHFCRLICWTIPSQWDDAQPKFEELVAAVK